MKSNELRIGNYVCQGEYDPNHVYQVWEIKSNSVLLGKVLTMGFITSDSKYDSIYPVEITEQYLIDFGFEKKEITKWHGNGYDYQPKTSWTEQLDFVKEVKDNDSDFIFRFETWTFPGYQSITISIHYGKWYPKIYEAINTEVKYIHQLQNLFFVITGEELTLPS